MIYYARSVLDGVEGLSTRYNLRGLPNYRYITEDQLYQYAVFPDRDRLFYAVQNHPDIHAYVLPDMKLRFHPDGLLKVLSDAYSTFFKDLIKF